MFVQGNTFRDVKRYFNDRLKGSFSDTELQLMLKTIVVKILNINDLEFLLNKETLRFSESELLEIRSVVLRLLEAEPFQYIVGETEFYGIIFKTDKRALVPRPETEELVSWVADHYKDMTNISVVDLCAGTGCIGIALKKIIPNGKVALVELSSQSIELIEENVKNIGVEVSVFTGDVLDSELYSNFSELDCIVSNPPYIPNSDKKLMGKNVLNFEPEMALFVEDEDPLLFYRQIAKNGLSSLKSGGRIFYEIHENFGSEVVDLLKSIGFVNIELRKDLQGRDRMVVAQKVIS